MPSTFSPLKIELIATGEQSGTWGATTNVNLGTAIEEAITGSADVAFSSADVTVTLTDTNAAQTARNLRLNLTGTSGGARQLILGSGCQIEKLYLINNGLADAVTVKNTSGSGVAVPAGKSMFVYNNGTNVVEVLNTAVSFAVTGSATVGGTLAVTGATTLSGTFAANGGVTLGDASGDALTINSSAVSIPNGLNFDSNTLVIDATNNRVGVNSASPAVTTELVGTDAMLIPKGAVGSRPAGVAGYLRFNTTSNEFEGYNGTAWASVGGAALSNDTSTSTNIYPLSAAATSGTASTLYTSNAKFLYKPSTGELQASELVASNGIVVNSQTVSASYTIAAGTNAMSAGPVTVASGQTVTVSSGCRWVVL
jgi:hypothetical protein